MSEPKWTRGTWSVDPEFPRDVIIGNLAIAIALREKGERFVVQTNSVGNEEAEANAILMSAAPDLFETLRLWKVWDDMPIDRGGKFGKWYVRRGTQDRLWKEGPF